MPANRLALTWDQVVDRALPPAIRKVPATSGRYVHDWAAQHHGANVQVELQALPAEVLEALFREAIDARTDRAALAAAQARAEAERRQL